MGYPARGELLVVWQHWLPSFPLVEAVALRMCGHHQDRHVVANAAYHLVTGVCTSVAAVVNCPIGL